MALGQSLAQALQDVLDANDRTNLEQSSEHNHVKALGVAHLCGCIHRRHLIYINVRARGRFADTITVVDEVAARLHQRLEAVQRGLV